MENGNLVVGLGNPGPEYEGTRHNLGFMVADALLARTGRSGWQAKFSGLFAKVSYDGTPIVLLKPQTFMNLSGRSVVRAAHFFRIEPGCAMHLAAETKFCVFVRPNNSGFSLAQTR